MIERPKEVEKERVDKISMEQRWLNSGMYILEPEILDLIPKGFSDFMMDIFPKALNGRGMFAYRDNPYIREIG